MSFLKQYVVSNCDGTTFMYFHRRNNFKLKIINIEFDVIREGNYWNIYYNLGKIKKDIGSSHISKCYHPSVPPTEGWSRGDKRFLNAFNKIICKYNYKLMMMRLFDTWNFKYHHLFLKESRDYIRDIFIIFNRIEKKFKRIPPEIICMILGNIKQLDLIIY
jgi:hypothetical protein